MNNQSLQEGLDDIFNNNENVATYTRDLIERGMLSYFTLLVALIVNGHRHEEMGLQSLSRRFDITAQDLHQALQRFDDRRLVGQDPRLPVLPQDINVDVGAMPSDSSALTSTAGTGSRTSSLTNSSSSPRDVRDVRLFFPLESPSSASTAQTV